MPRGVDVTPYQWERYFQYRREGFTRAAAAREVGIHYNTAKAKELLLPNDSGSAFHAARATKKAIPPIPHDELKPEPKRALEDFEYFRRRYTGHISTPWQIETAYLVAEHLRTPDKEFVVENCPPGAGKTTLAHDIAAWLTARDRRLRGLFGSRIENNARRQLRRLRRTLERDKPVQAKEEDIVRGLAVNAEACMAQEFGLFKPISTDLWKADEFIVAQFDDEPIEEKEPTWSSYGMDSGVLGNRFNFIAWDDVVDKNTIRTLDAQENQRQWWDDEAETRLEPGGLLWLIGQRMSATDLYRYNIDKALDAEEDDEELTPDRPRKYHHIVYQAHYEDRCTEQHDRDSPAYPEGCLLDPYRLPWRGADGLKAIQRTKKRTYVIQYQQEDADPEDVLVKDVWIWGGIDPEDGSAVPGCMDDDRDLNQLPKGLIEPLHSIATVDPSGKKMWVCQWWIHAPQAQNQTFLMDLSRKAMSANELLDWDANEGEFYGLMDDWQNRSVLLGNPIKTWIVEVNAAQRYLLAYDHVRRWMSKHKVQIIPHTTGPKKLDTDYGPWIMQDAFRYGRIRLPGKQQTKARWTSLKLIDEVTRWPNAGTTDDCVMAAWFLFKHLPDLEAATRKAPRLWKPTWAA